MSYREEPSYTLVACDLCKRTGAVGDRYWQEMRTDATGEAIHLCRDCRRVAVWCADHVQYHYPTAMHRMACAGCGGLFTSVVQTERHHCPSCYRALNAAALVPAASGKATRHGAWWRIVQRLWPTRHSGAGMPRR